VAFWELVVLICFLFEYYTTTNLGLLCGLKTFGRVYPKAVDGLLLKDSVAISCFARDQRPHLYLLSGVGFRHLLYLSACFEGRGSR
jgi:hypothetical protein